MRKEKGVNGRERNEMLVTERKRERVADVKNVEVHLTVDSIDVYES